MQTIHNTRLCLTRFGADGAAAAGESQTAPADAARGEAKAAFDADRRAAYEAALETYKDLDVKRIQNIIDKRFKQTRTLESRLEKAQPVLAALAGRHALAADDYDGMLAALARDTSAAAPPNEAAPPSDPSSSNAADQAAPPSDPSPSNAADQAAPSSDPSSSNAADQAAPAAEEPAAAQSAADGREADGKALTDGLDSPEALKTAAQRLYAARKAAGWLLESEKVKQVYPAFDLEAESKNGEFVRLVTAGVGLQTAYEVVHKDELLSGAMAYAAQTAAQKLADGIRTSSRRPAENALASHSPVVVKPDVASMTRAQRAEIRRRAARGEIISF